MPERANVTMLACGVGPVEAALSVARALERTRYRYVINVGIGGAFARAARVGEGRLIASERFADLGLEGGDPLALPDGTQPIDRVVADAHALACCAGVAPLARGLTVSTVTTTAATAARLAARYDAEIESMEGFAVLRAAECAGIPALEIRGISNYVGARAESGWDFAAGARAAATIFEDVFERLAR